MKFLLAFVALVTVSSAAKLKISPSPVEITTCKDTTSDWLTAKLDVDPYPIKAAPNQNIKLEATINLLKQLDVGATLSLKLAKKGLIDIPIPCIQVKGIHVGSCDYDIDVVLDTLKSTLCPDRVPEGQECKLPLKPGTYGGQGLEVTLPADIPSSALGLIVGKISAKAIIANGGEEVICVELVAEIEK